MKRQAESYFKEAGWLNKNYKPKYEEYMEVALTTSGYELLSTISFICMGDIATKEVFDWLSDCPKILKASSIICRALTRYICALSLLIQKRQCIYILLFFLLL